ncbi:unnamed protein product [Ilex paraguariensis]|uniref:Uncharacterized protein n=1 Tax=Ilex paraguariensis TaxID=185542 RepID=A0ABC8V5J4_9AQUA
MGEAWQGAGMQLKLQKVLRVQRGTREQWSVEWSALRCRWPKVSKDMAGVLHDRHALRLARQANSTTLETTVEGEGGRQGPWHPENCYAWMILC